MGQAFWTGVRLPSSPPEVLSGHIHGLFFYDSIYQKKGYRTKRGYRTKSVAVNADGSS